MGSDEKKSALASTPNGWKLPHFEPDDEYLQDMSHEDLQSLALRLKGYAKGDELETNRPERLPHHEPHK
jgi:hypothetical protein